MNKTLLITFGCSWVYGVGVNWEESMDESQYKKHAWDESICNEYSFRGLISKNLKIDNLNFSSGGSSNQRQFRLAKTFFFSDKFEKIKNQYSNIFVLWGITSTARNELFSLETNSYQGFSYHPKFESDENEKTFDLIFSNAFFDKSWEIDSSVYEVLLEILIMSNFLKSNNIKFLWYDLFNHHNYKKSFEIFVGKSPLIIDNFLHYDKNPRDLLSLILENNKLFVKDFSYHRSDWVSDNKKIHTGVKKKLLNVFTYHPTKFGHQEIAKILQPEIERLL